MKKNLIKSFVVLVLMLMCGVLAACGSNTGAAAVKVDCTVGTWSESVTVGSAGAEFNVTLSSPAPVYWEGDSSGSYLTRFETAAGTAVTHDNMMLPAGSYKLVVTPLNNSSGVTLKIKFYSIYDIASDYVFGQETPQQQEISPKGMWYKFTLTETTFTSLTENTSAGALQSYLYFGSQIRTADLSTQVLSSGKVANTLTAGTYYMQLYSTNSQHMTNGRVKLTDIKSFAGITEGVISDNITLGPDGANFYFNNAAESKFLSRILITNNQPAKMIIRNAVGETVAETNDIETLTLPQGEYFIRLTATSLYQSAARVLIAGIDDTQTGNLEVNQPTASASYDPAGKWFTLTIGQETTAYLSRSNNSLEVRIDNVKESMGYKTFAPGEYSVWLNGAAGSVTAQFSIQTMSPASLSLDGSLNTITTSFGNSKWVEIDAKAFVFSYAGTSTTMPFEILDADFRKLNANTSSDADVNRTVFMPTYRNSTGQLIQFPEALGLTKAYLFFSSSASTTINLTLSYLEDVDTVQAGESGGAITLSSTSNSTGYFALITSNSPVFGAIGINNNSTAMFGYFYGDMQWTAGSMSGWLTLNIEEPVLIYVVRRSSSSANIKIEAVVFEQAEELIIGGANVFAGGTSFRKVVITAAGTFELNLVSPFPANYSLFDTNGVAAKSQFDLQGYGDTTLFPNIQPGTYYLMIDTAAGYTITPTLT